MPWRPTPEDLDLGRLFHLMAEAVIVADIETGTVALANPAAEAMYGYEAGEMIGLPIQALLPERLHLDLWTLYEYYRRTRRDPFDGQRVTSPYVTKTGEEGMGEFVAELVIRPDDDRLYAVCVIRDATGRDRPGQQRLEGALLAARTLQHELNNWHALIVGYADLLAQDSRLPEDARVYARELLSGADGATRVLDRLRQITRIEEVDVGAPGGTIIDLARSIRAGNSDSTSPA